MQDASLHAAWRTLAHCRTALAGFSLREAFERDPQRFTRWSFQLNTAGAPCLLDLSKHLVDEVAWQALLALARAIDLPRKIDALFAGERVNDSEQRAALHPALRAPRAAMRGCSGDLADAIDATRAAFLAFSDKVRAGRILGQTQARFTDVIQIGVGGSELGPHMMVEALADLHDGPRIHFVSNLDGMHLEQTLRDLDPARTLCIVISKTFTTLETMTNARSAQAWFERHLGANAVSAHFVAVTAHADGARAFGIAPDRTFAMWDEIGGRYSLWSAVGLPIALAVGREQFEQMLAGAHAIDEHFRTAPLEHNWPVLLALLGVWYRDFWDAQTQAVVPYYHPMHRFVAHLQQLDMESNGKSHRIDGTRVGHATGSVVWGGVGTDGQHAYFQLLHQGTTLVPIDFLVAAQPAHRLPGHHPMVVANCLAQSRALMLGRSEAEAYDDMLREGLAPAQAKRLAPHRSFDGNRPSTTLVVRRFDAATLGAITALYEHKVYAQACVWGVNPFDQWGVEFGKQLAREIGRALQTGTSLQTDASTAGLAHTLNAWTSAEDR